MLTIISAALLAGCASGGGLTGSPIPKTGPSMLSIYNGTHSTKKAEKPKAEKPVQTYSVESYPIHNDFTRTQNNETEVLFPRLPNPDISVFVFPHLATTNQVPIPGYTTVLPLFIQVQYALPGEVK